MNALLLLAGVAGSTAFWVINRWASHRGARTVAYSFWMVLTGTVVSGLLVLFLRQPLNDGFLWTIGGMVGVFYAASLFLIMYAMGTGPSGPVVAVNNMGIVWPVVISLVWLRPRTPTPALIVAMLSVCGAVVVLSLAQNGKANTSAPGAATDGRRRALVMLLLWAVAGSSQGSQAVGAARLGNSPLGVIFAYNLVALVIETVLFLRQRPVQVRRNEVLPGVFLGTVLVGTAVTHFMAVPRLGAEVVFPFVVATPIIIMLLVARFVHHEVISRAAWIACLVGGVGLVLLATS
jgi:drug/metabolite transporter (DMT)-like permease